MPVADVLTAQNFANGRLASWGAQLRDDEFDRPYMSELRQYLINEEAAGHEILPEPARIFEALDETAFEEVRVVIIGQDPYPALGQAHGLAFSVELDQRPPSLQKIFAEVRRNMSQRLPAGNNQRVPPVPRGRNCLTPWARKGVLLLNRALTVQRGFAGAHLGKGWECFTNRIIDAINEHREHVVFMLWGGKAIVVHDRINCCRHKVLCWKHPRDGLSGSEHFSKANQYLEQHDFERIDWMDVCDRRPQRQEAVHA